MNEIDNKTNSEDFRSIFVSVGAFYPHHVGYEIHTLPVSMVQDTKGSGRSVQGCHTLNLEGLIMDRGAIKEPRQTCDITITDVSNSDVNYAHVDSHAYMGSLRQETSGSVSVVINVKPSIVRDVLNLFYFRAVDEQFQLKRPVIVRIDIPLMPSGMEGYERYKVIRVAFE